MTTDHNAGSLSGVSVGSVLQLIDAESKTCLLDIRQGSRDRGSFYIKEGNIEDAACGSFSGEEAAVTLLSLDHVDVQIKPYPEKPAEKKITSSLISLIIDGARLKDELLNEKQKALETAAAEESAKRGAMENQPTPTADEKKEAKEDTSAHREVADSPLTLKEILTEIAGKIEDIISVSVVGMGGAEFSQVSVGKKVKSLAPRMVMNTKVLTNICRDLTELGGKFEENTIQANKAIVYTKMITKDYFLIIVTGKEATVGMIHTVGVTYAPIIQAELP